MSRRLKCGVGRRMWRSENHGFSTGPDPVLNLPLKPALLLLLFWWTCLWTTPGSAPPLGLPHPWICPLGLPTPGLLCLFHVRIHSCIRRITGLKPFVHLAEVTPLRIASYYVPAEVAGLAPDASLCTCVWNTGIAHSHVFIAAGGND